jgi:methionyl-tRNA formyltransferase
VGVPQDESEASEWPGRSPADGELTATQTVTHAARLVRATTHPYPGAYIDRASGRLRVWQAHVRAETCDHGGDVIGFRDGALCVDDSSLESAS